MAQVGRRRIFISGSRVKHFETSGVVLNSAALDLHPFKPRTGELLLTSLLDRPLQGEKVLDLSMRPRASLYGRFGVAEVMLGRRRALGLKARMRRVPWEEVAELFDVGEAAAELVKLRSLHPSETARHMQDLTDEARDELVESMQDEDLANVLEELPEEDQAEILGGLDSERAARVLEEMEPDDAADLLSELDAADQSRLLEAMDPEEAGPLRRLLIYEGHSAGGLMTPEPIVILPEATVAEALARMRAEEVPAAVAACVFVTQPPTQPPTGVYLGGPVVPDAAAGAAQHPPGRPRRRAPGGGPPVAARDRGGRAAGRLQPPVPAGVRRVGLPARGRHRRRRPRPDAAGRLEDAPVRRSADLTTPRQPGRGIGLHYDPEAFGRFSEAIARTLGTARFLVIQTAVVVLWITFNVVAAALRFDPYPFILLNLAFSTQAAYAAP